MAITSLVASVVFAPLGIVFGHLALHQIKRSRERGRGLAIGGLAIGYLFTIIGVAALTAVIVMVSTVNDPPTDTVAGSGGSNSETAPDTAAVNADLLTDDEFYNDNLYPEKYRIEWAQKKIKERQTPELIKQFVDLLTKDNRLPLPELVRISYNQGSPIPPKISVSSTGDEILFQSSLDTYTASVEPDPNVGRKLLAAVMAAENPRFTSLAGQLGAGQSPITGTYFVGRFNATVYESPIFNRVLVGDYLPDGNPSKILLAQNYYDSARSEVIFSYRGSGWIAMKNMTEDDADWVSHPELIRDP